MMRRIGFWLLLVILAGGMALNTSLKARQQEEKLAGLKSETEAERSRLRILTAEWASLTAPARLEKLSARHLDLKPATGSEIISLADIPERLVPAPTAKPAVPIALAEAAPTPKPAEEVKVAAKPAPEKKAIKVAKKKPAETKQLALVAPKQSEGGKAEPKKDDMIRELIEKDQPKGVLWATFEKTER